MEHTVLSDRSAVEQALASDGLVPPDAAPSIGSGTMAHLRDSMARFSGPDTHGERRRAVATAIDALASMQIADIAEQRTARRLTMLTNGGGLHFDALGEVGNVVPTEALGCALGVADVELADLVIETARVARVIGRGDSSTTQDDTYAERILGRFADHPGGAVATVSLLYQNHDATAALLASHLHAIATGQERQSALTRTARVARRDCVIGGIEIHAGQRVELDLRSSGFEFGSGPHACPGRSAAEQIVHGICAALDNAGCRPVAAAMTFERDGRPSTIPTSSVEAT